MWIFGGNLFLRSKHCNVTTHIQVPTTQGGESITSFPDSISSAPHIMHSHYPTHKNRCSWRNNVWLFVNSKSHHWTYIKLLLANHTKVFEIYVIKSLAPVRWCCYHKLVIFKVILRIDIWNISSGIALRWKPQELTDDYSTVVQVMA